ncbi:synaptophysin-like protein 1 [Eublepharis macularius]|uniref:Synaptophysin-like protein 1 n=1 Tax=Eublepharis macularius TaxID=481883 RepID=A0AA97KHB0_EUBMA|nr:synaptophysin-like protein 1 [Eublepharis macularius]
MERVTQKMSGLQFNLGPAKEPLGFIKALEWIFAIFAFATCGGYSGTTKINVTCPKNNLTAKADFGYPFRLNEALLSLPEKEDCNGTWVKHFFLVGDFSSSAQFFVTFAVFVFLYCIAALVIYLCFFHLYRGATKLPMIDFIVTVVVSFLWLVSTSAWAKGLTDIKTSTGQNMLVGLDPCKVVKCTFDEVSSMGSLNVSVVVGFLNLILWAGNAWFVYKETHLHNPPAAEPPNPANPPIPSGM